MLHKIRANVCREHRYHLLYGVPGPIIVHCGIGRKAHKVSRRRLQRHRTASGLSEFHHTPSACVRVPLLYLGANRGGPVLCITSCMTCPYRTPRLHTDMPHQPNDTAVLSNVCQLWTCPKSLHAMLKLVSSAGATQNG
jgi:hypothetical protein